MAVDRFINAIIAQESGGNYRAVNNRTGALGRYQIMPQNLDGSWGGRKPRANFGWDYDALGRDVTPQELIQNPSLQDQIAQYQLKRAYARYGADGAARWWYSNSPNSSNARPRPNEPSPNEYAQSVTRRMNGANAVTQPTRNDPALALLQRRNPREYERIMRQQRLPNNPAALAAFAESQPAPRGGGGGGVGIQGGRDLSAFLGIDKTAREGQSTQGRDLSAFLGIGKFQESKPDYEAPTFLESVGAGMSDFVDGVRQINRKQWDLRNTVLNSIFGTDFDTNQYDRFTAQKNEERAAYDRGRTGSGETGIDWGRMAGGAVITAPVMPVKALQAGQVAKALGQNAAVGAAAGGAMFAEDGQDRMNNAVFGGIAGAVAPVATAAVGRAARPIVRRIAQGRTVQTPTGQTTAVRAEAESLIRQALQRSGATIDDMNPDVYQGLVDDAVKALRSGRSVNPDAVPRKAALDTVGLRGTRAQVSGRPQDWANERELAKISGVGDPLTEKFSNDSAALAQLLDDVARNTGGEASDAVGAMTQTLSSLRQADAQAQARVAELYEQARRSAGNNLVLNGARFVNQATMDLEREYAGSALPASAQKILKEVMENQGALTIGKKEELVRALNRIYEQNLSSGRPSEASHAIGIVRRALEREADDSLEELGSIAGQNGDAIQAWRTARDAARSRFQAIEANPALKAAIDDLPPDRAFEKFVLNGNERDIQALVRSLESDPAALNGIRQQVVQWISQKAVSPNNGAFSPANMNNALKQLGDRRLNALFSPQEVAQIKNIGEAARYLVSQPRGAAVNSSNTSAALVNHLSSLLSVIPLGGSHIAGAARMGASAIRGAKATQEVASALNGGIAGGRALSGAERELIEKYGFMIDSSGRLVRAGAVQGAVNGE